VDLLESYDSDCLDTRSPGLVKSVQPSACVASDAEVVKLVDALRSGRSSRKGVGVQIPPSA
jgi:hypothetical protein